MNEKRIALVTGANRGIGLEVVRQLLRREFNVVLGCRSLVDGQRAMADLDYKDGQLQLLELDVSDDSKVQKTAKEFKSMSDRLDVLVNNAAILLDDAESLLTVSEDALTKTWNTNSLGPLRVTRAFLPYLKKSEDARIINVSSLAGQLKSLGSWAPAYSISKTALNAVTCILANDLAGDGIKVNAVSPGWIRTDMGGPDAPGTVEEGADTIVWLATEADDSVSGQFLRDRVSTDW
jgi:NAD(P)-dependent dehydrogenase (short-subunit alcohol dehydrogenase family)